MTSLAGLVLQRSRFFARRDEFCGASNPGRRRLSAGASRDEDSHATRPQQMCLRPAPGQFAACRLAGQAILPAAAFQAASPGDGQ